MQFLYDNWFNIVSVISMIVVGVFAYFKFKKLMTSNKNITLATHRQKWLNDFRNVAADYLSKLNNIIEYDDYKSNKDFINSHHELLLYLNINGDEDKLIEEKMGLVLSYCIVCAEENSKKFNITVFKNLCKRADFFNIQNEDINKCKKIIERYDCNILEFTEERKIEINDEIYYDSQPINYSQYIDEDSSIRSESFIIIRCIIKSFKEDALKISNELCIDLRKYLKKEWEVIKNHIEND